MQLAVQEIVIKVGTFASMALVYQTLMKYAFGPESALIEFSQGEEYVWIFYYLVAV